MNQNNSNNPWYKVRVMPIEEGTSYEFNVQTHDLEWTMEQYQRNREPFEWERVK